MKNQDKTMKTNEKYWISTVIGDQNFIYIFKIYIYIEFRSFGGICCKGILTLQKTRFGGPGKTKLLVGFGLRFLRVFMGLDEFLQVCDFFFADCGEAASSKT